jgi:hypothetical protein
MTLDPLAASQQPRPVREAWNPEHVRQDLAIIAALPGRVARLLEGVGAQGLRARYREGGWTVAEIVHHLVDSHLHSYLRCKYALCENHPSIVPYDENTWVTTPECSAEAVSEAVEFLAGLHMRWIRMLSGLDEAGWKRTFHHPERDRDFALFQQAGLYGWHGEHHLAQAAMALGRSMPA